MLNPNHRILIVDDNAAIHEDFRKILCPAKPHKAELRELKAALFEKAPKPCATIDFELLSAYQGQEALALIRQGLSENRPFAMAFLDVRMPPGWDGVETASRLWQVDPNLQIVICSAYSNYSWEDMRARLDQPDSLVILKKPFDNVEVQQLAHAMTKKWLVSQQARLRQSELERMVEERTQELKNSNQSLVLSEERFSKAFHDSPLACAIQRVSDKRFIDLNQSLAKIVGYKREEMLGRTAADLFLWQNPELADRWLERLLQGESVRDEQANVRTQTGASHAVEVSCSLLDFANEPHMLLLAQDVAERALLERQLRQAQKMEAIGQLAAGVAHDFNNILTVIQGNVGLLELSLAEGKSSPKCLEQITKASVRAASLIRQLLMFSRKQVMQFRHLDLNESLNHAIKMLERLVGEHVQINFHPQPSLPSVYADASMIDQIAMNLAVNARDAMPDGGCISITTSLEKIRRAPTPIDPLERAGDFVCLEFTDTGMGMDTQILSRIYEPFFTTKPVGKGTGLGLSTVFGIVRAHQGWLEVDSKPERGTTFRIYFPASRQPAEKIEPVPEKALCTGRETVLVAEDEEALREMVVNVLRIQGYTVLEAASGHQALELWEQTARPIDLLLTDMVMPGGIMGGELAECLLSRAPRLKVIYTSGYSPGMPGNATTPFKGRNFLAKPYSMDKLVQFVRECLDSQPATN